MFSINMAVSDPCLWCLMIIPYPIEILGSYPYNFRKTQKDWRVMKEKDLRGKFVRIFMEDGGIVYGTFVELYEGLHDTFVKLAVDKTHSISIQAILLNKIEKIEWIDLRVLDTISRRSLKE